MVCVGADEQEKGTVAVRARKEGEGGNMTLDEFKAKLLLEIAEALIMFSLEHTLRGVLFYLK